MIMTIAVITPFIIGVCQKQSFRLYLPVSFASSICTLELCVGERFSSARKCELCDQNPPFGGTLLGKCGQGPQVWRVCLSVCLSLTRSQEVGPITRALQHGPHPGRLMNECREKSCGCGRLAATSGASAPTHEGSSHWILGLSLTLGSHSESFRVSSSQLSISHVLLASLVTPRKQEKHTETHLWSADIILRKWLQAIKQETEAEFVIVSRIPRWTPRAVILGPSNLRHLDLMRYFDQH